MCMGRIFTNRVEVAALIEGFEGYLARDRSHGTVQKYLGVLRPFGRAFPGQRIHQISAADIDSYLNEWAREFEREYGRRPKPVTVRNQVSALKAFYTYLDRFDYLIDARGRTVRNPMLKVDLPARACKPINWLKPAEDAALLACAGSESEKIVVWLLRHTGIRVSEARSLRIGDFDLQPGHERLYIRESKTPSGVRVIPIAPELVPRVQQWLDYLRRNKLYHPEAPFLSTKNGTAMQPTYVWRLVKRMAERAQVQIVPCTCNSKRSGVHSQTCRRSTSGENRSEVTPHTLRRTFASSLYNNDLPLDRISRLLGHSSTRVTEEAYAALAPEKLEEEFRNVLRRRAA